MSINIHGKEYVTVNERVIEAHEDNSDSLSITTDFISTGELVVCKATVTTRKGVFTGTSAANPAKAIEKASPYEVAETSAIGRALGFAGYGIVESIASAEEVTYATKNQENLSTGTTVTKTGNVYSCADCVKENKPSSIPENVYNYSLDFYGVSLCYVHQQKHTKIK